MALPTSVSALQEMIRQQNMDHANELAAIQNAHKEEIRQRDEKIRQRDEKIRQRDEKIHQRDETIGRLKREYEAFMTEVVAAVDYLRDRGWVTDLIAISPNCRGDVRILTHIHDAF
jgi:uncharacterized protein (DUF3084 family)